MDELIVYRRELLSALERVSSDLAELVIKAPLKNWYRQVANERHSAHQILVHLWVLEASEFALNIRLINDEESPVLPVFNDAAWMKKN